MLPVRERSVVLYRRVSHEEQGRSGLGLTAQTDAMREYCARAGRHIAGEFEDIESGAVFERPGLQGALVLAKRLRCPIVVSKIDRLSRDIADAAMIMRRVDVIAVDAGEDDFVLSILSCVAQRERQLIQSRVKAAMAVRRARGEKLGRVENLIATRGMGAAKLKAAARAHAESLRVLLTAVHERSGGNFSAMARELNTMQGVKPVKGGAWNDTCVRRAWLRLEEPA